MNMLLALLMTLVLGVAPTSPGTVPGGGPMWTMVPAGASGEARVIGADAAGARFVLVEGTVKTKLGQHMHAFAYDKAARAFTDLYLTPDVDAEALYDMLIGKGTTAQEQAQLDELIPGGKSAQVLSMLWRGSPRCVETAGDMALILSNGTGYILVNMATGATTPMMANSVTLAPDGRAVLCAPTALTAYDQGVGAYAPIPVQMGGGYTPLAARLLTGDRALVVARSNQMNLEGGKMTFDAAFGFIGPDGAIESTLGLGKAALGKAPDRLLYSEAAGVAMAYAPSNVMNAPLYALVGGEPSVLYLDGADADHLTALPVAQALDEAGMMQMPVDDPLLPLGLSQDQATALLLDMKRCDILAVELASLQVTRLAGQEQLVALFGDEPFKGMITVSALTYNGGRMLTGWGLPAGCAITLQHGSWPDT